MVERRKNEFSKQRIGVRVVKEVDLSPTGVMPRRFESCPMHQGSIAQSVERVAVNH